MHQMFSLGAIQRKNRTPGDAACVLQISSLSSSRVYATPSSMQPYRFQFGVQPHGRASAEFENAALMGLPRRRCLPNRFSQFKTRDSSGTTHEMCLCWCGLPKMLVFTLPGFGNKCVSGISSWGAAVESLVVRCAVREDFVCPAAESQALSKITCVNWSGARMSPAIAESSAGARRAAASAGTGALPPHNRERAKTRGAWGSISLMKFIKPGLTAVSLQCDRAF